MTEGINITKKFILKSPDNYLDKLKFYYMVHGKSISEFSPDLNILLRKFVIKKIYDLSQLNTTIKKKCEDFLNSICGIEKAKNISLNFDPEKICKYEDYISFIEKSFQQAEEDFNENILENNFNNYLQLIAVYRLICDISDLIDCWKEKDEKIEKFQRLCKYRCIQIITAKNDYEKKPLNEIDKEIIQMEKELIMNQTFYKENDKKEEKDNNINILKKNNTVVNNQINIKQNLQNDKITNEELSFPKNNNAFNFIDIKGNNPYLNLSLNFKEVYEKKKNEINDDNDNNIEHNDSISFQLVDNPYNSILSENSKIKKSSSILPPKKKIVKTIDNEQIEIEKMLNDLKGNYKNVNPQQNENKNKDLNNYDRIFSSPGKENNLIKNMERPSTGTTKSSTYFNIDTETSIPKKDIKNHNLNNLISLNQTNRVISQVGFYKNFNSPKYFYVNQLDNNNSNNINEKNDINKRFIVKIAKNNSKKVIKIKNNINNINDIIYNKNKDDKSLFLGNTIRNSSLLKLKKIIKSDSKRTKSPNIFIKRSTLNHNIHYSKRSFQ